MRKLLQSFDLRVEIIGRVQHSDFIQQPIVSGLPETYLQPVARPAAIELAGEISVACAARADPTGNVEAEGHSPTANVSVHQLLQTSTANDTHECRLGQHFLEGGPDGGIKLRLPGRILEVGYDEPIAVVKPTRIVANPPHDARP